VSWFFFPTCGNSVTVLVYDLLHIYIYIFVHVVDRFDAYEVKCMTYLVCAMKV
jgi:hypothetical protein